MEPPAAQESPGGAPLQAGRYRLGRVLGAGAMGVVRASYDPALDREVAIKLIGPRELEAARDPTDPEGTKSRIFDTRGAPLPSATGIDDARLLEEARALARVAHPNIVEVFDVGVCEAGVFIAMELIEGVPLRAYHEKRAPDWRAAVRLYLQAADALAAAHAVGLVHGDFKPDNALVCTSAVGGDDVPRVKVVDFGLARAIGRSAPPSSPGSERITLFGTPVYLAPECWADSVREPSADQFAFFVSLFESIAQRRPWPRAQSLAKLLQRLSAGPDLSGLDGRVPARLRRAIARGLDPEPTRRFPTITAAADELRAVLDGSRRDRGRLLLVRLLAAVALVLAWMMWPRRPPAPDAAAIAECVTAAQAIDGVWNDSARARVSSGLAAASPTDAASATRVLPWLEDYATAWKSLREQSCRAALEPGTTTTALAPVRAQCFEERRNALAGLVELLGDADRNVARDAVRSAADLPRVASCDDEAWLSRHAAWPSDPTTRERIAAIDRVLSRADYTTGAGRHQEALELIDGVMAEATSIGWEPLVANALRARARALAQLGRYDEAVAELERAYFAARESDDEGAAAIATERASLLGTKLGRFDEAQAWIRHAETALASNDGGAGETAARLALVVAGIQLRRGAIEDALAPAERARELRVRAYGEGHPSVASAELAIGSALAQLDRLPEAQQHFEQARTILERALGPDHIDLAAVEHNLAMACSKLERYDEAHAHAVRSLALRERWLPAGHPDIATSLVGLGNAELGRGRLDEAERAFTRALELRERAFGATHPSLAETLASLANVASKRGDCRAAAGSLERALGIAQAANPDDRRTQLRFGLGLADALLACHDREAAREQYQAARALAIGEPQKLAAELARADTGLRVTAG